jgi:TRAP-type mannitol/chloroaromatic compound transport system permease small subunit
MAWFTLLMVIMTAGIVIVRSTANIGSVGAQEFITYLHATVIMLASAYTLADNEHVRVDIFYRRFNSYQQAWVDLVGSLLFLLPFALVTMLISLNFVASSWATQETSADSGGLGAVYFIKALLVANGALLALQALADSLKHLVTIAQGTTANTPVVVTEAQEPRHD